MLLNQRYCKSKNTSPGLYFFSMLYCHGNPIKLHVLSVTAPSFNKQRTAKNASSFAIEWFLGPILVSNER